VIPLVPRLRDDRLERRELLAGHGQRAEDVLLEQRRARKREQQRRRERLSAVVARRERRVRLAGQLAHVVLQRAEGRAVGGEAVLHLLQALYTQLVAHVEPELAQLLLLHERAVFALSFPRGHPHALAARELGGGEFCGGWREGLCGRC